MRRRLISYVAFESIQEDSLSTAEFELVEAEPILSKTLGVEDLSLVCYGPESALYESIDGSHVHVNYNVKEGQISFNNIEQLIIDEDTEKTKSREVISKMVDSLLENNEEKASNLLSEYLDLPATRRTFNEFKIVSSLSTGRGKRKSKFRGRRRAGGKAAAMKGARTRKRHARTIGPGKQNQIDRERSKQARKLGGTTRFGKGQRVRRAYTRFVDHSINRVAREWADL